MGKQPALLRWELPGAGPEDIVVDACGHIITGVEDGRILRGDPVTGRWTTLTQSTGRPLGLEVDAEAGLWICDSPNGLLHLDANRQVLRSRVTCIGAQPLRFCSNVVADGKGGAYFTASSMRYPLTSYRRDLLEHVPSGMLAHVDAAGHVSVLAKDLGFANGLVLMPDQSALVVAETALARLIRFDLSTRALSVWADLPAMPDNMSLDAERGLVWVALVSPIPSTLALLGKAPLPVRRAVGLLPEMLLPQPADRAWVQAYDQQGCLVRDFCWKNVGYRAVTGVCARGDRLYMGSLQERAIAFCRLPD